MARAEDLHPTQFALGMRMVREKIDEDMKGKDHRHKFLDSHPVPVVVGPNNRSSERAQFALYPIDHHHLARAVLDSGHSWLVVEIRADWRIGRDQRPITLPAYWAAMERSNFVFLLDEKGKGPQPPAELPKDVAKLKDDSYRSLSAVLRDKEDCYKKTETPFAEFFWAAFFRTRVQEWDDSKDKEFSKAIDTAKPFCHSQQAAQAKLPGFFAR